MSLSRVRGMSAACAVVVACLSAGAPAQVVINEIHADPAAAAPALLGRVLEIWNQSAVPVSLANWQFGLWSGDAGAVTVPAVILGNCSFVIQDHQIGYFNTLNDPGLPVGVQGIELGAVYPYGPTWPWTAAAGIGCWIKNAAGVSQDYVYLRRSPAAAPAVAPNLPLGATWVNGNIAANGAGFAHLQRKFNTNHHSYLDWEQTPTAGATSWGAINTTGTATQTSLGPCVPVLQPNQPQATLTLTHLTPSSNYFSSCVAGITDVSFASTNIGLPFDVGVAVGGIASLPFGNFTVTPGGQMVNVDIGHPSFFFANGGTGAVAFPGNFTLHIAVSAPITASAQLVVVEPTFVDGYALSQAVNDIFIATPTVASGPSGHGAIAPLQLGSSGGANPQVCGVQALPFFGAQLTKPQITTSGRVVFGTNAGVVPATAAAFLPTAAAAAAGGPMVGVWCNLTSTSVNPNTTGSVWSHAVAPGVMRVEYTHVGYTPSPYTDCTYGIQFDTTTGIIQLDGLTGFASFGGLGSPGTPVSQFIGISAGGVANGGIGAVDMGPTTFTPGFHTGPPNHGMIYAFGQAGTLTPGITTIQFIPNAAGDYDYFAF